MALSASAALTDLLEQVTSLNHLLEELWNMEEKYLPLVALDLAGVRVFALGGILGRGCTCGNNVLTIRIPRYGVSIGLMFSILCIGKQMARYIRSGVLLLNVTMAVIVARSQLKYTSIAFRLQPTNYIPPLSYYY